jgi:putative transposase
VPSDAASLSKAISEAHRRYTLRINTRKGWTGYLWQGRYASFPLDAAHLLNAIRYIELNPVRAGLSECPENYRWSSASAHLKNNDDQLVKVAPLLELVGNWREFISCGLDFDAAEIQRSHQKTGRPLGDSGFIEELEAMTGRKLRLNKRCAASWKAEKKR